MLPGLKSGRVYGEGGQRGRAEGEVGRAAVKAEQDFGGGQD